MNDDNIEALFKQDVKVEEVVPDEWWRVVSIDGAKPPIAVDIKPISHDLVSVEDGKLALEFDVDVPSKIYMSSKLAWECKGVRKGSIDLASAIENAEKFDRTHGFTGMVERDEISQDDVEDICRKARVLAEPEPFDSSTAHIECLAGDYYGLATSYLALSNICLYGDDAFDTYMGYSYLDAFAEAIDERTWNICPACDMTHNEVTAVFAKAFADGAIEHAKADISYFNDEFKERAVADLDSCIRIDETVGKIRDAKKAGPSIGTARDKTPAALGKDAVRAAGDSVRMDDGFQVRTVKH